MAAVTIRNLPDETHRALKLRAAQNGRSAEAEIRAILEGAVRPEGQKGLGTILWEIGRKHGITDEDVQELRQTIDMVRDKRPAEPMNFD